MITKELLEKEWVENRLSQKQIANKYNVGLWLIEDKIKKFGLTGARSKIKYLVNQEHININSPIFWYLVGLTISDGYIDEKNKRIVISLTNDGELLEVLSSYYSEEIKIPVYSYATPIPDKIRYSLTLSSENLINLFHQIGITGIKKTETVIMPDPGNKNLFNFLLRGFIDGDGNIRVYKNSMKIEFRFYIHSEELTNSIINLFKKYYGQELIKSAHNTKRGYTVSSKVLPQNCLIDIYSDIPELALKRKRDLIKQQVDDIVHRYEMINHSNW